MPDQPRVSLVICTRNHAGKLPTCLAAIAGIRSAIPWELVIVDNGSTDGTAAVIAAFAAAARFMVRRAHEPMAGLGRARNTGWPLARGEFVAFTDDDCYVPRDHVDRVAALFSTPEIGYGGGRVTLFDPTDYPITIQLQNEREVIPPRSYITAGFIHGANMVFRRSVLVEIGGFDPAFGAGTRLRGGEDMDAQARASFAGWAGLYDPALTVAHHHGRKADAVPALMRGYGISRGAYFAKLLLRKDSRREFARHIYWAARKAPWRSLLDEAHGAISYLTTRMRS